MRLLDMFNEFGKSKSPNFDTKANKITILILDRSYDPVSPLVHDFHYLSMLADLKEMCEFKASYSDGQSNSKLLDLDESDNIYTKYKYRHIAELMAGVSKDFQEFLKTNAAAKL
jgi:syntaxin-binding protein 1